jgi:hypothetical protein
MLEFQCGSTGSWYVLKVVKMILLDNLVVRPVQINTPRHLPFFIPL